MLRSPGLPALCTSRFSRLLVAFAFGAPRPLSLTHSFAHTFTAPLWFCVLRSRAFTRSCVHAAHVCVSLCPHWFAFSAGFHWFAFSFVLSRFTFLWFQFATRLLPASLHLWFLRMVLAAPHTRSPFLLVPAGSAAACLLPPRWRSALPPDAPPLFCLRARSFSCVRLPGCWLCAVYALHIRARCPSTVFPCWIRCCSLLHAFATFIRSSARLPRRFFSFLRSHTFVYLVVLGSAILHCAFRAPFAFCCVHLHSSFGHLTGGPVRRSSARCTRSFSLILSFIRLPGCYAHLRLFTFSFLDLLLVYFIDFAIFSLRLHLCAFLGACLCFLSFLVLPFRALFLSGFQTVSYMVGFLPFTCTAWISWFGFFLLLHHGLISFSCAMDSSALALSGYVSYRF